MIEEKSWMVDFETTAHILVQIKNVFTSYKAIGEEEEHMILGDSRTVVVLGVGRM